MKRKVIVFAATAMVCLVMIIAEHVNTTAEASSNKNAAVVPTAMPEKISSQIEVTTSDYYINDGNHYTGEVARRLTISENGVTVEPTPIPNFELNETVPEETIEYFEANDITYKVVSTVEWVTNENITSEVEDTTDDYEEKILRHTCTYWYSVGLSEYKIATLESNYTVLYYTNDNKVLLSNRTHTSDSDFSTQIVYGKIVNTDGSVNYTSGDMFKITYDGNDIYFPINFFVTPTTYSFK